MAKGNQSAGVFKDIGLGEGPPPAGAVVSPTVAPAAPPPASATAPPVTGATSAPAVAAAALAAVPVAPAVAGPPGPKVKWVVEFYCPTGVANPTLEVEASNEAEAWELFMKSNGITASVYKPQIRRAEAA